MKLLNGKLNNVSELRLSFALAVVISHSIQLGAFVRFDMWRTILSSDVAVHGFFILSGYLVLNSYERSAGVWSFWVRRALRIYPAYLVAVILFVALGVGQAMGRGIGVAWGELPGYLLANLALLNFLQPQVGGVFEGAPISDINGALWTIKVEVMFYALVPILYVLGRAWSFRGVATLLLLVGLGWEPILSSFSTAGGIVVHPSLMYQLPGQLHYFALGILIFDASKAPDRLVGNLFVLLSAVLIAYFCASVKTSLELGLLSLSIFGVSRLPQVHSPLGKVDPSYGIYLCHFPLIQLLVVGGADGLGFGPFIALVLMLSIAYGIASWHWIEAPALEWTARRAR